MGILHILEVVVGLLFIFTAFSLFASTLVEAISGVLGWRGTALRASLQSALGTDFEAFWSHPSIEALKTPKLRWTGKPDGAKRDPSQIDPATMAAAALQIKEAGGLAPAEVSAKLAADKSPLGQTIRTAVENAGDTPAAASEALTRAFDGIAARVSGSYVRRVKTMLFVSGVFLAMATSFNVFTHSTHLYQDSTSRDRLKVAAEGIANLEMAKDAAAKIGDPVLDATISTQLQDLPEIFETSLAGLKSNTGTFWNCGDTVDGLTCFTTEAGRPTNWAAWLVMGFVVMLGAQFWFDLLQRFVSIRASGAKVAATVGGLSQPPEKKGG